MNAAEPFSFFIPHFHPATVNQLMRGHWSNAHKLKKADREIIGIYGSLAKIPYATGKRLVGLTIVLAPGRRGADGDAYWKSSLDALVACGYLLDDNRQHCELQPVKFERGSEDTWGTVIRLQDLAT